jgi:molybdenum cofactor cytidylyltransferase
MKDTGKISIIILAAGASTRFGKPKQLLEFKGKTLLRKTIETALETNCYSVCVVLGANYNTLKKHITDLPVEIVRNTKYREGMMSSLKAGLKRLIQKASKTKQDVPLKAVIVMLSDQPLVESELIKELIRIFQEKNPLIVACKYSRTYGAPVLFSHLLFDEILQSSLKEGAKPLIQKYKVFTHMVSAPQASVDIDTLQDYQKLLQCY